MKQILIKLTLACLALLPVSAALPPAHSADAAESAEKPVLSFPVLSDIHVNGNLNNQRKFKSALEDLNQVNPDSDVLIINGDLTSAGTDGEYNKIKEIMDMVPHPPVKYTIGNHEFYKAWYNASNAWDMDNFPNGETEKMSIDRFLKHTGNESVYYDEWINDHHFIFLGSEQYRQSDPTNGEDAYLSDTQLNWLESSLAEQARGDKPIFVFLHQPLPNTVSGSSISINNRAVIQHERLIEILSQYPQVVYFSGHTHWTLNMPSTMAQKKFTMFNSSTTADPLNTSDQSIGPSESEGLYVQVYEDRVVVKGRDFSRKKWIEGQEYTIPIKPIPDLVNMDFAESATKDLSPAGNDGTEQGKPKVQYDEVFKKNVLVLDGASYVRIADNEGLRPEQITMAASFSLDNVDELQDVVAKNQNSDYGLEFNPATKQLEAWMYIQGSESGGYVVASSPALDANRKYDVAVTYDGEAVKFYLDGKKVDTKTAPGKLAQAADPVDLAIGVDPEPDGGARSYFKGKIGYVKLYSKALTEEQITGVSTVVDKVSPVWSEGSKLSGSNLSQTSIDLTWTAAVDNVGVTQYRIINNGTVYATVDAKEIALKVVGLQPKTKYVLKIEAGDDAGNWTTTGPSVQLTTKSRVFEEVGAPDLLNFTFTDSATMDSSSAQNNGTVSGNAKLAFDSNLGKNALVLDGESSYIRIKDNEGLKPDHITLTAAFSLDSLEGVQDIIAKNQSSDYGFEFNPSTGKLETWTWIKNGDSADYVILQSGKLKADTVYHAAMTFDGHENALYINGLKVDSKQAKGVIAQNESVDLTIGADPEIDNGARSFMKGKVYLAQVYSKGLTAGQVQTLYSQFAGIEDGAIIENPSTGDTGIMLYVILALVSGVVLMASSMWYRRRTV